MAFRKEMRDQEDQNSPVALPCQVGTTTVKRPRAGKAAKNQGNAFANIKAMKKSMKRSLSEASMELSITSDSRSSTGAGSLSSHAVLTEEQLKARDRELVDEELSRYFGDGIIEDEDELADYDIVNYWNVSDLHSSFSISNKGSIRTRSISTKCYGASQWTCCLRRHQQCLRSGCSLRRRKQIRFVGLT